MAITLRQCRHGIPCTGAWRIFFCTSGLFGLLFVALHTLLLQHLNSFNITTQQNVYTCDSLDMIHSKRHETRHTLPGKKTLAVRSLWLDVLLSDKDSQLVKTTLNDKYKSYLRPVTTIISNLPGLPSRLRHLPEDIIQSGYGLQPYKTEKGEDGWIENGIVYRPSRPQNTVADAYTPEYESYVPFDEDLFFGGRLPDPSYRKEKKIILWYFPARYINPIDGLEQMKACPEFPCLVTTNRSRYVEQSAALIFAADQTVGRPPQRTSQKQIFILHNHEPGFPQYNILGNWFWRSAFNWTLTYRMDSDIVVPYGIIRRRPKAPTNKDYRSIFAQKSGLVAWAVSHCSTWSRRERYVKELRQYIPVDVIGKCGRNKCSRVKRTKCTDEIARKYKFHLGFENAFCSDYLTEKIFYYMSWDIVSVARGSNEYYLNLPSNIFINTNDFPSPQKLAERLWYLANNETAYIEILRAKDEYMVLLEDLPIYQFYENGQTLHNDFQFHAVPMCQICQRLWNLDRHSKTIKDVIKWFKLKKCKAPADLHFSSTHTQT